MIWIVIGPVICFILLLFVGGAVFVIFKKKYDLSLLHVAQTQQASETVEAVVCFRAPGVI